MSLDILGPNGKSYTVVGGDAAFRKFWKHDIAVSMQWYTNEDEWLDEEPCMFISCPSRSKAAYIIPLRDLHQFVTGAGNYDARNAAEVALRIANHIGVDPTSRSSMHAIMDVLYENLPDLLKMPPKPEGMRLDGTYERPTTEVTLHQDGKAVLQTQLLQ